MRSQIDGLVQDCSNSIAKALELLQSCTKPWKWYICIHVFIRRLLWILTWHQPSWTSQGSPLHQPWMASLSKHCWRQIKHPIGELTSWLNTSAKLRTSTKDAHNMTTSRCRWVGREYFDGLVQDCAGVYTKFSGRLSEEPFLWLIQKFPCILIFKTGQPGCQLNLSKGQIRLDLTSGRPLV